MTQSFADHIHTLEARWWQALEDAGYEAAVISAGPASYYYQDDQSIAFRANPDFAQWLPGDDTAGGHIVVRKGQPTQAVLFAPEDYWHAAPEHPSWAEPALRIEQFAETEALQRHLAAVVAGAGRTMLAAEHEQPNLGCEARNDPNVLHPIHFQRADKTGWELEQLRAASLHGARGHIAARDAFHAGGSEFEINMAFLSASRQDAEALPYHSIVALNEHAGVLHYQHYERAAPAERHSFLIDAGARVNGYASDITRTYAAQDQREFSAMIEAFDAHQQKLIAAIETGRSFQDLHVEAHRAVAHTLAQFGLVSCSAEAAFELGITGTFLPHGLGHLLGIQTHDIGGHQVDAAGTHQPPPAAYPALRLTREIATGQVFTIEPGIYFIPMLLKALAEAPAGQEVVWSEVERYLPCGGIRIEDDVHVSSNGVENLTRNAFKELESV